MIENPAFQIKYIAGLVAKDGAAHRSEPLGQPVEGFRNGVGSGHALIEDPRPNWVDEGLVAEQHEVHIEDLRGLWAEIPLDLIPVPGK